jgi:hypothetical protein
MLNQLSCPVCGNPAVAEFFEPRGAALCMQCGAILRRLRNRLVLSYHPEPDRITLERSLAKDFDSLDVVGTDNGAGGRVRGQDLRQGGRRGKNGARSGSPDSKIAELSYLRVDIAY